MVTEVSLNNLYILCCMILGVTLSLWVGLRYVIRVDRRMTEAIELVKKLQKQLLKHEEEEMKFLKRKKRR